MDFEISAWRLGATFEVEHIKATAAPARRAVDVPIDDKAVQDFMLPRSYFKSQFCSGYVPKFV